MKPQFSVEGSEDRKAKKYGARNRGRGQCDERENKNYK